MLKGYLCCGILLKNDTLYVATNQRQLIVLHQNYLLLMYFFFLALPIFSLARPLKMDTFFRPQTKILDTSYLQ